MKASHSASLHPSDKDLSSSISSARVMITISVFYTHKVISRPTSFREITRNIQASRELASTFDRGPALLLVQSTLKRYTSQCQGYDCTYEVNCYDRETSQQSGRGGRAFRNRCGNVPPNARSDARRGRSEMGRSAGARPHPLPARRSHQRLSERG